ncbi:MAG: HD domain-containing protein [Thermodesulfobacteriota bacterium]|nr:HD domain-containing protein [Thermodesulfobacteriota bacterium]
MADFLRLDVRSFLPPEVLGFVHRCAREGIKICVAGGTIRDVILGREVKDIDLTVSRDAPALAQNFAEIVHGAFILLDDVEKVARVVFAGYQIDFAEFRKGSRTLEEDLSLRDLTINAMAVCFAGDELKAPLTLIDPVGGHADIEGRLIRFISGQGIIDDPLRMLRAYRFAAALDFKIDPASREMTGRYGALIKNTSVERIAYELNALLGAKNSYPALRWMAEDGLFSTICPEIEDMYGVQQYGYHHLDVYGHSFLTLYYIEKIEANPADYFPDKYKGEIEEYLRHDAKSVLLKWAALFHDIGKPKTAEENGEKSTFYNHDQVGAAIFANFARRLKWSHKHLEFVEKLIYLHMRPFHLVNVLRSGEVTPRALRRLIREAGDELTGLFVLAMADSLAGIGPAKPDDCEALLVQLFETTLTFYKEKVKPLLTRPRLITGHDLINIFHLEPGPFFKVLMEEMEDAQVEGRVSTRDEALEWVTARLKEGSHRKGAKGAKEDLE